MSSPVFACTLAGLRVGANGGAGINSLYDSFLYVFCQDVEVELEMGPTYVKPKACYPAFADPCMRACCPAHESVMSVSMCVCVSECIYINATNKYCNFRNLNPNPGTLL